MELWVFILESEEGKQMKVVLLSMKYLEFFLNNFKI